MSQNSKIEWTEATWNPVRGCTKVSAGCKICYAERIAERFRGVPDHPYEHGFDLRLVPEKLSEPLSWKTPRRVFVNSMSDLFQEGVPDEFIDKVFAVMALCPQHTFQILTKRPQRMKAYFDDEDRAGLICRVVEEEYDIKKVIAKARHHFDMDEPLTDHSFLSPYVPPPNAWIGVSAENQEMFDLRVPLLLHTPASVRFVSLEPLLGPIDLVMGGIDHDWDMLRGVIGRGCNADSSERLDWVIVGGESGPGARPMHPHWVRSIRDQCVAAGVPFFFKQWGVWHPGPGVIRTHDEEPNRKTVVCEYTSEHAGSAGPDYIAKHREKMKCGGDLMMMYRVGKKRAGRILDGRTWDEYPVRR